MAALTATFASAQKQSQPEWQSQYAVGLNKLAPHTYVWPYADASDIEIRGEKRNVSICGRPEND